MLLIMCVERLLHIGSHFSLRKWRQRPHFPTKLAAVAGGLIFLQNWRLRLHFPTKLAAAASLSYKIGSGGKDLATLATGGCSDMVWILAIYNPGGTILTKNVILRLIAYTCGMILAKFIIKYILNT